MKNKSIYPWVVVGLLWIVALLNYMDRQMLSTMQEAMKVDIVELNKAEAFGALMAIFLWIYGFMSPVAGIIADRVNRKWLVVGSLFVWSAVTFLMGYAHDFHELYWLRAIMGVSEALYIPSALSLIADWHEGKSRSLAVGVHMTGLYVGQAIGGFGATAAAAFSWQATFHWFGIVGIVYSLVLILFLKENPIHNVSSKKIDNVPGEKKPSIISGLSLLFTNWAFWIILFYFADFLVNLSFRGLPLHEPDHLMAWTEIGEFADGALYQCSYLLPARAAEPFRNEKWYRVAGILSAFPCSRALAKPRIYR